MKQILKQKKFKTPMLLKIYLWKKPLHAECFNIEPCTLLELKGTVYRYRYQISLTNTKYFLPNNKYHVLLKGAFEQERERERNILIGKGKKKANYPHFVDKRLIPPHSGKKRRGRGGLHFISNLCTIYHMFLESL